MPLTILYIAKHGSGGNDDEGAIGDALDRLGHRVLRVQERLVTEDLASRAEADFCLFHKWYDPTCLYYLSRRLPCVFWYFDLVRYQDESLAERNGSRISWMMEVLDHAQLGFCTDGDWVNSDSSGKLVRLCQGIDQRAKPYFDKHSEDEIYDLTFTGISRGGGSGRESFVRWCERRYARQFRHVSSGVHGSHLARLIYKSKILLAPDHPATDDYWSNRLFLTLGYGGFLLHPHCETVRNYYTPDELVTYHNRDDLATKIDYYLRHPEERERIRQAGFARTWRDHTYQKRCEQLVRIVQERVLCPSHSR